MRDWGDGGDGEKDCYLVYLVPHAQCPMPNAPCPSSQSFLQTLGNA
ncbi:histidine kinase [Nostoc linckia]|nr:histidine kinase [Nostoc linckia]